MEITAKEKISGRVAQAIVAEVNKGNQTVLIKKDGRTINAGSLLGLLSLVIMPGDVVEITTAGDQSILDNIKSLF
jgi:catabolite repression HPr-like protein